MFLTAGGVGGELGHPASPGDDRLLALHTGARIATPAHERLHEQQAVVLILRRADREAGQRLRGLVLAAHHDEPGVAQPFPNARAVEQAAGDGVDASGTGMRRVEVAGLGRSRVDAPGGEDLLEFGEGQHLVDGALHLGVQDLRLLGHTRPDEHAAHRLAIALLHGQRGRHHRRDDRHHAVREGRVVLAHVFHDRRAGAGDVQARRVLSQVFAAGLVHQVGAVGHLDHIGEAGLPQRSDHLSGRHREAHRERRGQQRRHRSAALDLAALLQQPEYAVDAVGVRLGVLRADDGAVATTDAALRHHRRLAVLDADGLGRAVPHAGVAPAAVLLDSGDDAVHQAAASGAAPALLSA